MSSSKKCAPCVNQRVKRSYACLKVLIADHIYHGFDTAFQMDTEIEYVRYSSSFLIAGFTTTPIHYELHRNLSQYCHLWTHHLIYDSKYFAKPMWLQQKQKAVCRDTQLSKCARLSRGGMSFQSVRLNSKQKRQTEKCRNSVTHKNVPHLDFSLCDFMKRSEVKDFVPTELKHNSIAGEYTQLFLFSQTQSVLTIPFLGYLLKMSTHKHSNGIPTIVCLINMNQVIDSLSDMGFCDRLGNPKPNFRYYQDSQYSAVARVSSILRGLASYYDLAEVPHDKRRCMTRWSYILTHSLAMVFAAKFKLGTRARVFARAGRNLQKPIKKVRFSSKTGAHKNATGHGPN
jgi:hypothetical protein